MSVLIIFKTMELHVYSVIVLFVVKFVDSQSRRNIQRQVDSLEKRYEHDYVSMKENLRDLWTAVDQLETVCKTGLQITTASPAKQFFVQHKSAKTSKAETTKLIRGFSEEKEFLRKSLRDLNDTIEQAQITCSDTIATKMSYMNDIDARCYSVEKNVEELNKKQTLLIDKVEKIRGRFAADVDGLRMVINEAVEEMLQNSYINKPSSCIDLVKHGVTSSGVYTLFYKLQPFIVYCLIRDGSGYTFISPETYMDVSIKDLSNDNSHVLIRHRRTNGLQYESRIEQISRYKTRPLSVQYNTHEGYSGVVNGLMTPYIYVGLNPKQLVGRSHRGDTQGYKSNGKDFTFRNCDGNPNGYFAFLFNHNNISPSGYRESPAISRKWLESSTRVSGDILPDKFMSFFELHFGGCGAYAGTNHIPEVTGAAVGIPFTMK